MYNVSNLLQNGQFSILAVIFVTIATVKVKLISDLYTWAIVTVFFSAVFLGPKFGPIPLAQKYAFSPILKENYPQNEVFIKKNRQNVTTACPKCV